MKDQIPQFLQEQLTRKKVTTRIFPEEIKNFMERYDKYYNWQLNGNLRRIIIAIRQNLSDLPQCTYKGCFKL